MVNEVYTVEHKGFERHWNSMDLLSANEFSSQYIEENIIGKIEENVDIKGSIHLGENSVIKSGTYIEGPIWIGENCTIDLTPISEKELFYVAKTKWVLHRKLKTLYCSKELKPHHNYVGDSIAGKECNLGSVLKLRI